MGLDEFDTNAWHFSDAFKRMGHDVIIVGTVQGYYVKGKIEIIMSKVSERHERYKSIKLIKKAIAFKPDIVINLIRILHPDMVPTLRKALPNAIFVSVNNDQLANFGRQQIFATDYDFFFSKDSFIVDFMRNKMGLNSYQLLEYFNPRIHLKPNMTKAEAEEETNIDVLVFGLFYPYRTALLKKLVDAGIKITMFGRKSKYFPEDLNPYFNDGFIRGERKSKLVYGAKIVFNNFHYAEVSSVNQKYFEINGIGGFQICDFKESLKDYSPINPEKYTFKTIEEAIDLIKYYLQNPEERHEIADRNYRHFNKYHTIDLRAQKILDIIDGKES